MEEKCKKAPVFSVETVFKESAEVPVDIEFNLPDYCPEISRILKCRAVPRVSSKSAANRGVTAEGSVTVTVIYADGDEIINSYEYQYPFSKSFETETDTDGGCVTLKAKCEYVNCRAVTGRKIDIHGAVGLTVTVTRRVKKEIVCGVEDDGVKTRRISVPATVPEITAQKYLILEEEIELGAADGDIKCLICYDASAAADECKLLADKAVVKGSVAVNLLYRGEDGSVQPLSSSIPYSQLIEAPGAEEGQLCEASAYLAYLEIKPKFSSAGGARAFSVDGKVGITVKTYTDSGIDLITDAYSLKYEAQIENTDICVNKLLLNINDAFTAKKDIDLSGAPVSRIFDIRCDINEENTAINGDCARISGTVVAGILAEDAAGAPQYFEKTVEYEYTCKLPAGCENIAVEPCVTPREVNYTLASENRMEIRVQMSVFAAVYECEKIPAVSGVALDESKPVTGAGRPSMTVYFAEEGESVWDISRRYLADNVKVMKINGITGDNITGRQMILLM